MNLINSKDEKILINQKPLIQIILGSTRTGRKADKIGNEIKNILIKRNDIDIEIVDLKEYNLPFFDGESPISRKEIVDPNVKKWSEKINSADGFIIVVPEYNHSLPAVLKNALDFLYHEWNYKPIAFAGYSGSTSGGTRAIEQLRQVIVELKMIPIRDEINIPESWKAFDEKGNLINRSFEKKLPLIIDDIIYYISLKNDLNKKASG